MRLQRLARKGDLTVWDTRKMGTRYDEWMHRWVAGTLGIFDEFYGPVEAHPAYAKLVQLCGDADRARWEITRDLLPELISTAGAVEYHVANLHALLEEVQVWADREIGPDLRSRPRPLYGTFVGHGSITHFAWVYQSLLGWGRAFEDRGRLTPPGRLKDAGDIGLVPSLNTHHPIAGEVRRIWDRFQGTGLPNDVRNQSGLALHVSSIHRSASGADLTREGRVVPGAPDPVASRVATRGELSYDQGREALAFADDLWDAIAQFTEGVIGAFERYSTMSLEARKGIAQLG